MFICFYILLSYFRSRAQRCRSWATISTRGANYTLKKGSYRAIVRLLVAPGQVVIEPSRKPMNFVPDVYSRCSDALRAQLRVLQYLHCLILFSVSQMREQQLPGRKDARWAV
jgi:hypothetical protein